MRRCPHGTLLILFVHVMMNETSNRLKYESSDNDDSNDGMAITSRDLNTRWVNLECDEAFDRFGKLT